MIIHSYRNHYTITMLFIASFCADVVLNSYMEQQLYYFTLAIFAMMLVSVPSILLATIGALLQSIETFIYTGIFGGPIAVLIPCAFIVLWLKKYTMISPPKIAIIGFFLLWLGHYPINPTGHSLTAYTFLSIFSTLIVLIGSMKYMLKAD